MSTEQYNLDNRRGFNETHEKGLIDEAVPNHLVLHNPRTCPECRAADARRSRTHWDNTAASADSESRPLFHRRRAGRRNMGLVALIWATAALAWVNVAVLWGAL